MSGHTPGRVQIVFDGPPLHESGRFVEVEDGSGHGIRLGEWVERDDGLWALVLPVSAALIAAAPSLLAECEELLAIALAKGEKK